jgi:hypothetical protein
MCLGSGQRIARSAIIHPCADCAALPEAPGVLADVGGTRPHGPDGPEYRPPAPRKVTGVKPPLCFVHRRRREKLQKAATRANDRERRRGITEDDRGVLWAAQGEACAICGHRLNVARKAPSLDHCHDRAALHDHPVERACRACARGLLCTTCNRWTAGRDAEPRSLLGRYKAGDNPAAGLGWWTTEDDRQTGSGSP